MQADVGCGKTFTFNALLAAVRGRGQVALAVATSGIAATLMEGGRTAHNRFILPIHCLANNYCGYINTSDTVKLLRKAKLIAWDEAPMAHRYNLENPSLPHSNEHYYTFQYN